MATSLATSSCALAVDDVEGVLFVSLAVFAAFVVLGALAAFLATPEAGAAALTLVVFELAERERVCGIGATSPWLGQVIPGTGTQPPETVSPPSLGGVTAITAEPVCEKASASALHSVRIRSLAFERLSFTHC
jgi:hypothetical protein